MERTLSIVKPDAVKNGQLGAILDMIEGSGLKVVATRMVHLTRTEAEGFYAVHRQRPFFASLVEFMTSGPCLLSVLSGEDAIVRYRDLMGATNPDEAKEGTIRKRFATNIEQNAVHGSDAPETARFEISYFFREVEILNR